MATIIHSPIASGLVRPGPVVVKPPFEFRAATVINFDDVPDGTVIDTHYAAKGATFASVTTSPAKRWSTYARSIWGIESAPNGVSLVPPPTLSLFDARQGGIEVTFDKAQRWVSIDAQPILPPEYMTPPTARPFLEAYDAKGKLLVTCLVARVGAAYWLETTAEQADRLAESFGDDGPAAGRLKVPPRADPQREADAAFADLEREEPALQGKTSDGVTHRLWRLTDPAAIAAVQRVLRDRSIYIADGHHRYETMLALREELRREPGYCGLGSAVEYGSIFLCNVADPGLLVFPTHRVLHSLPGFDLTALVAKLQPYFHVTEAPLPQSGVAVRKELEQRGTQGPSFLVVSGGRAVYLTLRADAELSDMGGPAVLRTLDVTLLHALVLEQALGIDRAAQEAQTYLRYVKDNEQALQAARAPDVQAVFLMNPTRVAQVMACSDAGEVMPQKSTYFYPKIASGLVLNPLDPAEPGTAVGAP